MHYLEFNEVKYEDKYRLLTDIRGTIEGLSPMFYEYNGTCWNLDKAADEVLWDAAVDYWVNSSGIVCDFTINLRNHKEKEKEYMNTFPFSGELYDSYRKSEDKMYGYLMGYVSDVVYHDVKYLGDIDTEFLLHGEDYFTFLLRNPGEAVLQYFHDQLVFESYIQNITVPVVDNEAIDLLDSGVLLDPLDRSKGKEYYDRTVFDVVDKVYSGWWT